MPSFQLPEDSFYNSSEGETLLRKGALQTFNPSVLGLGDISTDSKARPAIAALFDLQGFTVFCKQIEPHLSVPIYLEGFLSWIFQALRKETISKESEDAVTVWHELPFFVKFMGDGLLVLWDTSGLSKVMQHNLLLSCHNIILAYKKQLLPSMKRKVTDVPPALRCGIAKGTVFSVGEGQDYVGSCINVAARLQRLATLSIAFSRRGFVPEAIWKAETLDQWLLKQVPIRGVGESELVYLRKTDFERLAPDDKALFLDP